MAGNVEGIATLCFAAAILHTFSVKQFQHWATSFKAGSIAENFFHLLGEIEVVFGLWAGLLLIFIALTQGGGDAIRYLESRNFLEPAFVFVIMVICATRPILHLAGALIESVSRALPLKKPVAFYATCLVVGPLLGSFITEPAAMTVTALILFDRYYKKAISQKLMYATLGLLFVNISIGGTLTPYAAPPVLMVAKLWHWDLPFMLGHFGWKAALSIVLATSIVTFRFRDELAKVSWKPAVSRKSERVPRWISVLHLLFLAITVIGSHHVVVFSGAFLFFLGLVSVTREYQDEIRLREGLLVAFFLGGLVVLGGLQRWWLEPLLTRLDALPLFLGSMGLTAITDNAALTYLGAQVPELGEVSRYALVAGAVTGGGLTVIANAPNPAGYGILNSSFGDEGISPLLLFRHALFPTAIAALCFWIL
jgi:Na+/H+ antiporter NhaD/arsenite permease-like protein